MILGQYFDQYILPLGIAGFLVVTVLYRTIRGSHRLPLPPGPAALPILGNALQISPEQPWLTFAQWSEKYGEIMHCSVLGQSMVILSSQEAIRELLVQRGAIYSSRPEFYTTSHIMGWDKSPVFCRDQNLHREGRKLMTNAISGPKLTAISHIQEAKCQRFLSHLLTSPDKFRSHIEWFIASVIFDVTLGRDVADKDDPFLAFIRKGTRDAEKVINIGGSLLDLIPPLRYVPEWMLGPYRKNVEKWRVVPERTRQEPWNVVRDQMSAGIARTSFVSNLLEEKPNASPDEINFYQQVCATFYAAGIDTTIAAVESFFLAMSLYPDVQKRAQAELDAVTGHKTLPTFASRQDLPYLNAVLKEVHRWNPVGPLAVPHVLIRDDEYKGYRIPKDALILPNSWLVMHDPATYPDPYAFNPDRYLSKEDVDSGLNPDPRAFAFGYGKRVCPGQYLAEDSLFIIMASVLSAFDIAKAVDSSGNTIEPVVRYIGVATHPSPFGCKITPRSGMAQLIANLNIISD